MVLPERVKNNMESISQIESVHCYDIAIEAINTASQRIGHMAEPNHEKLNRFKEYCEIIDSIATDTEGKSIEITVNSKNMDITISLVCDKLIVDDDESEFYTLAGACRNIAFTPSDIDEDCIKIDFMLYGIWDMA